MSADALDDFEIANDFDVDDAEPSDADVEFEQVDTSQIDQSGVDDELPRKTPATAAAATSAAAVALPAGSRPIKEPKKRSSKSAATATAETPRHSADALDDFEVASDGESSSLKREAKKKKLDKLKEKKKSKRPAPEEKQAQFLSDNGVCSTDSMYVNVTSVEFEKPRDDSNLCDFLKLLFNDSWHVTFNEKFRGSKGSPRVLFLCPSADRCVVVLKHLKGGFPSCKLGKFFSRHMKLAEQIKFSKDERFPVAVGTPNRFLKLLGPEGEDSFKLEKTDYVVLDSSYVDKKQRNIFDIPELTSDLKSVLALMSQEQHPKLKIVCY
ncbi:U3-containing 90S pre-ribosomal complex subunit-domain containing protein [Polychytrium aggregatum]|uniref:U3-containing 90S pre-ribosomal complex subunit-domain containing protein n=1 Tax=Polychytrium aggregatum TaxID=110093 RepID=UPI0022FDC076|nr:U3-containing 90S pre-ribosomal complex subunit-domain containing protein [Polychytrium aggregatum]KAI9205599.1 U3-containing 90S pre-ribosomal complex subunit-domain containing protein [Polychytrium aggregatum]